jgi:uncharacterized membrane protein YcjF (UPF0283 family)
MLPASCASCLSDEWCNVLEGACVFLALLEYNVRIQRAAQSCNEVQKTNALVHMLMCYLGVPAVLERLDCQLKALVSLCSKRSSHMEPLSELRQVVDQAHQLTQLRR